MATAERDRQHVEERHAADRHGEEAGRDRRRAPRACSRPARPSLIAVAMNSPAPAAPTPVTTALHQRDSSAKSAYSDASAEHPDEGQRQQAEEGDERAAQAEPALAEHDRGVADVRARAGTGTGRWSRRSRPCVIQRRSSTITRCAHGITPPNERAPMERKPSEQLGERARRRDVVHFCLVYNIRHAGSFSRLLFMVLAFWQKRRPLPIFDAHLHYSHDAWECVPVAGRDRDPAQGRRQARAGLELRRRGPAAPLPAAPDLVIPELRPYRRRGEIGTWFRDETVVPYLEERLAKYRYVAHRRIPPLRRRRRPAGAARAWSSSRASTTCSCTRIPTPMRSSACSSSGRRRASCGRTPASTRPENVAEMLRKHKNLWCDLAFRTDHGSGGKVDPAWRKVFLEFPDRFMVGTDTFTPERWHYVGEHADWSRALAGRPAARRGGAHRMEERRSRFRRARCSARTSASPAPAGACDPALRGHAARVAGMSSGFQARRQSRSRSTSRSRSRPARRRGAAPETLKVDAHMPEHRHGMNYAPTVKTLGPGRWRAEGLMLPHAGQLGVRLRVVRWRARLARAVSLSLASSLPEEEKSKDPRPRPVAAAAAARSEQPRLRQAGGDRARRAAVLRAAPLGHRLGAVRDLPRAVRALPGRAAARLRPGGGRSQHAERSSTCASSAGSAGTAAPTACGRRASGRCSIRAK